MRAAKNCRWGGRGDVHRIKTKTPHLSTSVGPRVLDPQLACDRDAATLEVVAEVLQGLLGVPRADVASILVPLRREDALEEPLSDRHVGAQSEPERAREVERGSLVRTPRMSSAISDWRVFCGGLRGRH